MRILTAGESHGEAVIAIIEGFPRGVSIDEESINRELARRQQGYGRGRRMAIEKDRVHILSGLRNKITLGSPIALMVKNRDQTIFPQKKDGLKSLSVPRPAHADLAGALKYKETDMRNILERSSARETVARVCVGSVCSQFLADLGIAIAGHVISIGPVRAEVRPGSVNQIRAKRRSSLLCCLDPRAEKKMISQIDKAAGCGDTLGGIIEVWAQKVPAGLGSCMHYDQRLDARIAAAMMSIPAVKGVEIGAGFEYAGHRGSLMHDAIYGAPGRKIVRRTNNAGGIEGGMSNGQPVVVRLAMKPIATLAAGLDSVHLKTGKKAQAPAVRSDVCAVPACAVVAEHMLAIVLCKAFLDKFGSDCLAEIKANYKAYCRKKA